MPYWRFTLTTIKNRDMNKIRYFEANRVCGSRDTKKLDPPETRPEVGALETQDRTIK